MIALEPMIITRYAPATVPKICTYGYRGDLNVGWYHSVPLLSLRRTMTLTFSATITMIWKPEASLATSFTGSVKIHTAIVTAVRMIAQ